MSEKEININITIKYKYNFELTKIKELLKQFAEVEGIKYFEVINDGGNNEK